MPAILILIPSSGGSECTGITGTLPFIESSPISFSGTKDNTFRTTVSVTTPTADRTLTLPDATGTITVPATTAETKTGALTDKAVTPAGLLASIGLSAYFESAEQTITSAGALTIAHGLGREPILFQCYLINVIADNNYSVGNKLIINPNVTDLANNAISRGVRIVPDSTNLNVRYGSNADVFSGFDKSTGNAVLFNNAHWKLVIRAWG